MGAGALLELAGRGTQDIYLIGNPTTTFFKTVYLRHTNFSKESIGIYSKTQPDFGRRCEFIIDKKADLLAGLMLEIDLPSLRSNISWANDIGHTIIQTVELSIGGETICSMLGEFLNIQSELTVSASHRKGFDTMIGHTDSYSRTAMQDAMHLQVQLPFWFCKELGSALPLIAMQYSEIKVIIEFRQFAECWYSGSSMTLVPDEKHISNAVIYADYIYLDIYERTKFATMLNHEYLIEQVQTVSGNPTASHNTMINCDMFLNHPVKELLWVYQADAVSQTNDWSNFSKTLDDSSVVQVQQSAISACKLKFSGHDRFEERNSDYFRLYQPYQHHTSIPQNFVYIYSFAKFPEKIQPSGTCNFSKIDNVQLEVKFTDDIPAGQVRIYAINYNILKITNGMSGLLYSS
jgi:hypothetical protein